MVTEFGMSDASGNGQISTINTGKWLKRLDQINVSYFCWSLTNKNESSALLAPGSSKTGNWKKKTCQRQVDISVKNIGQNDRILLRMADGLAIMKKKERKEFYGREKRKTVPADHMLPAPIVPVSGVG